MITADDADILLNAIDQTLTTGSSAFATPLADIRSKIAYLTGETNTAEPPVVHSPTVDAVWSAFADRCALRFLYQNGRGEQRQRTVCVYGMFEREGTAYFCGLDDATGKIRTFRCDRIVRAWRPSRAYAIPADFNLNDYLFFEFDFSDCQPSRQLSRLLRRLNPTWSTASHVGEEGSSTPKTAGPGPLTFAT
mgnify:CR=1 FL=1